MSPDPDGRWVLLLVGLQLPVMANVACYTVNPLLASKITIGH